MKYIVFDNRISHCHISLGSRASGLWKEASLTIRLHPRKTKRSPERPPDTPRPRPPGTPKTTHVHNSGAVAEQTEGRLIGIATIQ
eukprot:2778984-Pyramimonas_sp.AAC.1